MKMLNIKNVPFFGTFFCAQNLDFYIFFCFNLCVSFNLDCSLVIRMKTDSKIELEFNKETDEITYFNYLNRNIYSSFLLSNVMIRIEEFIEELRK